MLDELEIQQLELELFNTLLYEFENGQIILLGRVKLPVTIDTSLCVKTYMVDLLMVDYEILYKALMERPFFFFKSEHIV